MSIMNIFSISASGMSAQRARVQALAENLANAETTRTPEGGPYRRKDVVFESAGELPSLFAGELDRAMSFAGAGVRVAEIVQDQDAVELRYQPGHPDANEDGYVSYPAIHPADEMVNLQSASRAYDANIAVMNAAKEMVRRSLELFR